MEDKMGRESSTPWRKEESVRILIGKSEENRPQGRPIGR
jgi:hypothetical protein